MRSLRKPFRTASKAEPWLYEKCRPAARWIKILLQFLIGAGLAVLLVLKLLSPVIPRLHASPRIQSLVQPPPLELVAIALAYSSGFELAYTLFTAGPDEAVEPVIMGLAAAMLLGFSKLERIDVLAGCGSLVFVIALAGLFFIRDHFLPED